MTMHGGNQNGQKGINKWVLFGLGGGLGLAGGVAWGYSLGKKETLRRAKEAIKRVRNEAWNEGSQIALDQAEEFINENMVLIGDTPEETRRNAEKAIAYKFGKQQEEVKEEKAEEVKSEKPAAESHIVQGAEGIIIPVSEERRISSEHEDEIREEIREKVMRLRKQGLSNFDIARMTGLAESTVRKYTKDMPRPGYVEVEEDIDNYDLSIDDDEAADEEAREMTEAREEYLDHVERYLQNPAEGPHYISQQEFNEEVYLEKVYVDYFEKDKVFVGNDDGTKPLEDPVTDFGTADGDELFRNNPNREDEDIVTMRNFKMNAVYEITRHHGSYGAVRDGSAYLNGNAAGYGGDQG